MPTYNRHTHRRDVSNNTAATDCHGYFDLEHGNFDLVDNVLKDNRPKTLRNAQQFIPPCMNQILHHHNQRTVNGPRGRCQIGHENEVVNGIDEFRLGQLILENPVSKRRSTEFQDLVHDGKLMGFVRDEYSTKLPSIGLDNNSVESVEDISDFQPCTDSMISENKRNEIVTELKTACDPHETNSSAALSLDQWPLAIQPNEGCEVLDMRSQLLDPDLMNGFTIVEAGPPLSFPELETERDEWEDDFSSQTTPDVEMKLCESEFSDSDNDEYEMPIWLDLEPVPGPWSKWSFDALFFPDHLDADINSREWCPAKKCTQHERRHAPDICLSPKDDISESDLKLELENWYCWYADDACLFGQQFISCRRSDKDRSSSNQRAAPKADAVAQSERVPIVSATTPKPSYICKPCGVSFDLQTTFTAHGCVMNTAALVQRRESSAKSRPAPVKTAKSFACKLCDKQYKRQWDCTRHMKTKHLVDTDSLYSELC